ncbi:putative histone methyltransferase complex subunit ash2, partial [Operophtera brumata]
RSDMSHFGDFMDGVPVKISEKYKRPPRIELPYTVNECPIRAQNAVDSAKYCSTFESNVLAKLKELRGAKETKKNERRHRLQLLEEAKQKKLDAIAVAEDEQRLKQLSVSEVSYPSTEEISALSPDEKADETCDIPAITDNTTIHDANLPVCPTDSQMNILQPVQVKCNYKENNSLMDEPILDPLQNLRLHSKVKALPTYSRNVDALTFRDFENDTSSPFDNVELKTINEMELLAQVLQSQLESSNSCNQQQTNAPDMYYAVPNCSSQAQVEGVAYVPNSYVEQPGQGPSMMYAPQQYPTNGYYIPTENENMYMPNYQYYVPTPYQTVNPYYHMPTTSDVQVSNGPMPMSQPYYCQYPEIPVSYHPPTYNMPVEHQDNKIPAQNTVKSRSRSVSDIVRELNEEIALSKQRLNEKSLNPSPTPKNIPQVPSSSGKREEKRHRKKSEQLPNPYLKLSPKLQEMCRNIHGMGFPLDRVARICTLVGDNDKKVIEGLLILDDLMDLGFSEGKVSATLAKHEFNRDKALDELVS